MKKENKFITYISLLLVFFKVGLLTFGGGYVMIPIIEREVAEKKKWIKHSEMIDIITISESTPGPIAVNAATYIGFRVAGFWGSFFATLGLAIPSFTIIFLISLIYEKFMTWTFFIAMFKGLKVGVILLLLLAVTKLKKSVKYDVIGIICFAIVLIALITLDLFQITVPCLSLIFIALGLLLGILIEKFSKGDIKS